LEKCGHRDGWENSGWATVKAPREKIAETTASRARKRTCTAAAETTRFADGEIFFLMLH